MDSVLQTMVNEKIGPGERAKAFVQLFCESVGTSKAVAFRSYPDCLRSALVLMDVKEGSRVAVSPLSPSVYKSVIEGLGAQVVYVDIDMENGCPKAEDVASSEADVLLLFEAKGTLPLKYNETSTYTEAVDYGEIKVIEDISESIGSRFGEEFKAGGMGSIVVCAMEEDGVVSAAGGAVLGTRGDYSNALRACLPSRYIKMPDLNAALGAVQLSNLQESSSRRLEIQKQYIQSLMQTRHKRFGLALTEFTSNGCFFSVLLDSKPDEAIKFAQKYDVPLKMAFSDSLVKDYDGDPFEAFPVAASYYYRTVDLPLYLFLKTSEVNMINKVISHLP